MQGHDVDAAQVVARRIINAIVEVGNDLTRFPLSASVGIATGSPNESAEQILRRADHAMYTAKAQGPGNIRVAARESHVRTPIS
jgi:GGDEF domain-containing protein